MRFVGELQFRAAAMEHDLHDASKFHIDGAEGFGELGFHGLVHVADDGFQAFSGLIQIIDLILIESPPLQLLLVGFFALVVEISQSSNPTG